MPADMDMLAGLFYRQLENTDREDLPAEEKVEKLRQLLQLFFLELTIRERFHFSTLFARIAYAGQRYGLDGELPFYIHLFRRKAESEIAGEEAHELYLLGLKVLVTCIRKVTGKAPPNDWPVKVPQEWPLPYRPAKVKAFRPRVRVLVLRDDPEAKQFIAVEEERPGEEFRVQYDIPERNDHFADTITLIRKVFGFPVSLNLIDVEIDEVGVYRPRAFVVEPDYLVDVSAIAECFKPGGPQALSYFVGKFLPFESSPALLLGQIANFFLDELLGDPGLSFKELFPKVFRLYPLNFCLLSDQDIRELMHKAVGHHQQLRQVIVKVFPEQGIEAAGSQLEPTFYSEKYGLQGRLDLYHHKGERRDIVELKSGKVFMPNSSGLSINHYTQTLLYDLLIRSVGEERGEKADPSNYILYSGQAQDNLRYAPRSKAQQFEALQIRNKLMALEAMLCKLGLHNADLLQQGDELFGRLHPSRNLDAKGFFKNNLFAFMQVLTGLDELERKYFYAYAGFIAREHRLAKTGTQGAQRNNGQSTLWLDNFSDKEQSYAILRNLAVVENRSGENEPELVFQRSSETNPLANFRHGDIAVLYPATSENPRSPLMHQVFKGTIIELTSDRITFRLRSRQFHHQIFEEFPHWNLEPDLLDSSFGGLYRSLFAFSSAPPAQRALWLGKKAPSRATPSEKRVFAGLSEEQADILSRMIDAKEYFLLWGPPGTGKTSIMLRSFVDHIFNHTDERLLLLAYTNRAVDEICASLESIGNGDMDYLRIGSRYSTHQRYRPRLLKEKLGSIDSRQALRDLISSFRIIVGTVSSLAHKPELFKLQSFDRVVIDEASQILEPSLMGLLPFIPRVILVGDHKQLPAVVVQDTAESVVGDKQLQEVGVTDMRNALFERLFRRCLDKGWTWAFAQLRCQGRMHREIMQFPGEIFYGGKLDILPSELSVHQRQLSNISAVSFDGMDALYKLMLSRRVLFIPTEADRHGESSKTNKHEAEAVVDLVSRYQKLYLQMGKTFDHRTLGVITPYRAQIARIRMSMEEAGLAGDEISVDTVERYQGGARDIILLSLCTNSLTQLTSLISLSDEGVDRKLNVALTRAREHLVILGNVALLEQNSVYADLISRYKVSPSTIQAS